MKIFKDEIFRTIFEKKKKQFITHARREKKLYATLH